MKWALVLLVACGKPEPAAKPKLDGMTADQKCKATAPRGEACADEIYNRAVAHFATEAQVKDVADRPAADAKAAAMMHAQQCVGDTGYADHLVACWDQPDCKALADCVYPKKP